MPLNKEVKLNQDLVAGVYVLCQLYFFLSFWKLTKSKSLVTIFLLFKLSIIYFSFRKHVIAINKSKI